MSEPKTVTAAIVISLIAGILIILGSIFVIGGSLYTIGQIGMILGAASGILVLFSAMMLKTRPGEGTRGLRVCCRWWGTAILTVKV